MKKFSFTHIASLGLFLLVLLQVVLTMQAMELTRQAADTVETISTTLVSRSKKLAEIDKSLNQAYYLFLLDKNFDRISVEDILNPLIDCEKKIRFILEISPPPEEKETLPRALEQIKMMRQGVLSITEMGTEQVDYIENLVEQVQNSSSTIRNTLISLELLWGKNSDNNRLLLPLHEAEDALSRFDETLQSYLDMETLDISTLVHMLAQAESVLQLIRLSMDDVSGPGVQKVSALESLLSLLRTNLPATYYRQELDPNISLAAEGLESLAQTWDQMIYAMADLRTYQESSIAQAEHKLWAMTMAKRIRFFALACASIAGCLIIT
ncbi:MAG: hypothetical protein KKD73_08390, partial [Proteobacteria bacterium]|nr:hypothetical protein [Pseudomonadota bacterium]MBU1638870.1 hypothetical protein [Pseudomonadota bacterium]